MSYRLLKIDSQALADHHYLDDSDQCYFFGEYTAGEGHAYSKTNQLILNYKKGMDKKNTPQWMYKEHAIKTIGEILRNTFKVDVQITFVPIPPSKAKDHPLYDDRLLRSLNVLKSDRNPDIRELVVQKQTVQASHLSAQRPTPGEVIANYIIDDSLCAPAPETIIIFDDVITTGCHFKAMKTLLLSRFPDANIVGFFMARRVPKSVDLDSIDLDSIF